MLEAIQKWTNTTGTTITTNLKKIFDGDVTVLQGLQNLFQKALEEIKRLWETYGQQYLNALQTKIEESMPAFRAWLLDQFKSLASEAVTEFAQGLSGLLKYTSAPGYVGSQIAGYLTNPATYQGVTPIAQNRTSNQTININGAGDPATVANEVMQRMAQADRLGLTGARLR